MAPVIAAAITGTVTLVTALVVARIADRQAKTAANKLALDMFEKRHAVWRELVEAYTLALRDLWPQEGEPRSVLFAGPGLLAFGRAKEKAFFLFGIEVRDLIAKLEMHIFQHSTLTRRRRDLDVDDEEAFEDSMRQIAHHGDEAQDAWRKLGEAIGSYLMLDKIAVNKPAKQSR